MFACKGLMAKGKEVQAFLSCLLCTAGQELLMTNSQLSVIGEAQCTVGSKYLIFVSFLVAAPMLFSFCARRMASCYGSIYIYNVDFTVI